MVDENLLKELRERMVNQFLDLLILLFLNKPNSPETASNMFKLCKDMFGVEIDSDSMYRLLLVLEKKGLIQGSNKEVTEKKNKEILQVNR